RADADIRLAADYRLGGDVLRFQVAHLDVDAALLRPLDGDLEVQRLDRGDIAEGDVYRAFGGGGHRRPGERGCHARSRGQLGHSTPCSHDFFLPSIVIRVRARWLHF